MKTFYPPQHIEHQPPVEFWNGRAEPISEVAVRVDSILHAMQLAGMENPLPVTQFDLAETRSALEQIHSRAYLDYLDSAYDHWVADGGDPQGVMPFISPGSRKHGLPERLNGLARPGAFAFDMGAVIVPGTAAAALASAQAARLAALEICAGAASAYALCRPPGHHAGTDFYGGYCYLNNAALAVETLRQAKGGALFPRVALLDVDVHHGNGSQDIFYQRADVFTISLHMDPAFEYPFFAGYQSERGSLAGEGYNSNYPLPLGTGDADYLTALTLALDEIAYFGPAACVVSLGVDTYAGDPIGKFKLSSACYTQIGKRIAGLGLPTVFVQEGGYNLEYVGTLVTDVLIGFEVL